MLKPSRSRAERRSFRRSLAVMASAALITACSDRSDRADPRGEVRGLTSAHTRVVWVQQDGNDPEAVGDALILMGFDSDDGRGERIILGERGTYVKPLITPRGDRIIYSTRPKPGPAEVFVVNWDGSGQRKLGEGFALGLWRSPDDGREWVFAGTDITNWEFSTIWRFPIDAPEARELAWNSAPVSIDNFQVSADGRFAGGMFPWPEAAIADLHDKSLKKLGQGCWPALTTARGLLYWYFDGAHRNLTMVDVEAGGRWIVNVNNAPGFDGAEANHPRWTNHPRFMTLSGPYNLGGPNQARAGGPQTEIWIGRFSDDFARIEGWARVTTNGGGDSLPDAWVALGETPHPVRPGGAIGPSHVRASRQQQPHASAGRLVVNARLLRGATIPTPESILPYRNALIVNEYEIMDVVEGAYTAKEIRVAHWGIRDGRVVTAAERRAGAAFTFVVERHDAHGELEGERVISASEQSQLPLYYEISK
jgi:hypothetical protein